MNKISPPSRNNVPVKSATPLRNTAKSGMSSVANAGLNFNPQEMISNMKKTVTAEINKLKSDVYNSIPINLIADLTFYLIILLIMIPVGIYTNLFLTFFQYNYYIQIVIITIIIIGLITSIVKINTNIKLFRKGIKEAMKKATGQLEGEEKEEADNNFDDFSKKSDDNIKNTYIIAGSISGGLILFVFVMKYFFNRYMTFLKPKINRDITRILQILEPPS